jgi:hypothetical protein
VDYASSYLIVHLIIEFSTDIIIDVLIARRNLFHLFVFAGELLNEISLSFVHCYFIGKKCYSSVGC